LTYDPDTAKLEDALSINPVYEDFYDYLKLQFNEEKLECWSKMVKYDLAVEANDPAKCEDLLKTLWNNHLKGDAPKMVYFESLDKEKIEIIINTKKNVANLFKMEKKELEFELRNTFKKFIEEIL